MRIKHLIYLVNDGVRKLAREEIYEQPGKAVNTFDYLESPVVERRLSHDSKGRLICEVELQGDVENRKNFYEYDHEDEIIDIKTHICGALWEHVVLKKTDTLHVTITMQGQEEVERVETVFNGDNSVDKTYRYGELSEVREYIYDENEQADKTIVRDLESGTVEIIKQKYNEEGEIILQEEFQDEVLQVSTEFLIENGKVISESLMNFMDNSSSYKYLYQYDEDGNMVKFEGYSDAGLLSFWNIRRFDSVGRLIEEEIFSNGKFSGPASIYLFDEVGKFLIVHEYEEMI